MSINTLSGIKAHWQYVCCVLLRGVDIIMWISSTLFESSICHLEAMTSLELYCLKQTLENSLLNFNTTPIFTVYTHLWLWLWLVCIQNIAVSSFIRDIFRLKSTCSCCKLVRAEPRESGNFG